MEEFELSIYRIVQELLQNIIKHARATEAIVQLIYREDTLLISVVDNGIGFSVEKLNESAGMGLKSLRIRLKAVNGIMDLQSGEEGTAVYLEFDIRTMIITNHPAATGNI